MIQIYYDPFVDSAKAAQLKAMAQFAGFDAEIIEKRPLHCCEPPHLNINIDGRKVWEGIAASFAEHATRGPAETR